MINRDGHIHTSFCPHGSKDPFEAYVQKAIRLGREEITFTEHFPLPKGVTTESFTRECSLLEEEIELYFKDLRRIKAEFEGRIKINIGFEVDYVEGFEEQIRALLNVYGEQVEDAILSVHFVKYQDVYYAIDELEDFEKLLEIAGNLEIVYDLYFRTVLKSIEADLGEFKPKRIGHPSLIRIFNRKHAIEYDDKGLFKEIALKMAERGYEFDWNVAGLRKAYCGETYPSGRLLETLKQYGVNWVGGSDSHEASQMGLL